MRNLKRVAGILGVGHVGAHVAYSLAVQGIADEIILVDKDQAKAACECQDITDSVCYLPHRPLMRVGDFKDLSDCGVLINAAGDIKILLGQSSRLKETEFTINAVDDFVGKVMASGFDGVVINIANPCDIVARQFAKLSGLPKGRVFGTGTGLDTARLLAALAKRTGIDQKSISACVMGEHGVSQMVPWSCVGFGGCNLSVLEKSDARFKFDHEQMRKEARDGGWVVFHGKQCTEYGICSTAAFMASVVFRDEKRILPVSAELSGEYGESDIFVGVPAVIGANGVEKVIELPLTDGELRDFKKCCADIRENMAACAAIKK